MGLQALSYMDYGITRSYIVGDNKGFQGRGTDGDTRITLSEICGVTDALLQGLQWCNNSNPVCNPCNYASVIPCNSETVSRSQLGGRHFVCGGFIFFFVKIRPLLRDLNWKYAVKEEH